jgi:hypothetical protein
VEGKLIKMLKKCPRCNKILPDSMFAPKTRHCKICRRDYDWQYKYGISPEQYFELYQQQEGKCKICGEELNEDEYLCIDHDKETGEIRGLLCKKCNLGLGHFKDSPDNLRKAAEYLEENDG